MHVDLLPQGGRRLKLATLALLSGLLLVGCGKSDPVQLGFLGSLSGRSSDLAEAARNGVQLAIEQRNAAGGLDGRKVELIVRDDAESPETALKGAAELASTGVAAIVGPITSSMTLAALPAAEAAGVVLMTPTATSMQLVGRDDHLFRINAATRDYARAYADFHYRVTGLRRLAIAMDVRNRAFTQSWLDEFQPAFAALGGQVATVVTFESAADVSFSNVVEQLMAASPDGLLFIAGTVDVVRLSQEAKRRAVDVPLIAVEWAASEKLYELGGSAVEGLQVVESYDRTDPSGRYGAFVAAYRQRFQLEPGYTSVNAYDAANVILDALSRRQRGQSLKEALLTLGSFEGLQQPIQFDRYGDTSRQGYFMTLREGRFVPAR